MQPITLVACCMAVCIALPGVASGQSVPGSPPPISPDTAQVPPDATPDDDASDDRSGSRREKSSRRRSRRLEWGGRIYVRDSVIRIADGEPGDTAGWFNQLMVDSARFGVKYDDSKRDMRIEVEAEFAGGDAELKDAYIRWQPRRFLRLQMGQFKEPISAITLESRWSLPVIERGLLSDLKLINELTAEPDELPTGGRNIGVQATLRGRDIPARPELFLGVFRSRVHEQLAEALGANRLPLGLSDGFPEDAYARLQVELVGHVQVGATLGWIGLLETAGTRDSFQHGYISSVDAVVKLEPIRLWVEAFKGINLVHLGTTLLAEGQMTAVRGIASTRISTRRGPFVYVEPYASGQYLDVSDEVEDDTAREFAGGLVLGVAESWRIQVEYDHRTVDSRLSGGGTRVSLQAGAVF